MEDEPVTVDGDLVIQPGDVGVVGGACGKMHLEGGDHVLEQLNALIVRGEVVLPLSPVDPLDRNHFARAMERSLCMFVCVRVGG